MLPWSQCLLLQVRGRRETLWTRLLSVLEVTCHIVKFGLNSNYFHLSVNVFSALALIGDTFQVRIGIWKCWFLRRGENRSARRKTSRSREENQQQTQPTYDAGYGNRTRDTLVGGERSHHCAIPAPPTRPYNQHIRNHLTFHSTCSFHGSCRIKVFHVM